MSQQPTSPFGSRPGTAPSGSRFGAAQAAPNTPNAPSAPAAPTPPSPPRPSSLPRFGASKMNWRVVATTAEVVRLDMNGLGDPFYRLLGSPLNVEFGDPEKAIQAIENGGDDVNLMIERLETAWQKYALRGAILLYPWHKELRQVFTGRIPADEEDGEDEVYEDDKRKPPVVLRALDILLVMNVLARARSRILLPTMPLALEGQLLGQSLFSDDPRLIALARGTGYVEEVVFK